MKNYKSILILLWAQVITSAQSSSNNWSDLHNSLTKIFRKLNTNSTQLQAKTLRPSVYNPASGSGLVQSGVNLFTGQPSQSLPLVSISHGSSQFSLNLNYGSAFAQMTQDNAVAPSGVVGVGWDLSLPMVAVNNKGTSDLSDDVFYCNLGAYGGGQILASKEIAGMPSRFFIPSNPSIQVQTTMGHGEYEGQVIAWRFKMPDGKMMIFGDPNASIATIGHIRYQLGRGPLVVANTVYSSQGPHEDPNAQMIPYRWDLNEISDLDGLNSLKFDYEYGFHKVNQNTTNYIASSAARLESMNSFYVQEGYLHSVYWYNSKGAVQNQLDFIYSFKNSQLISRNLQADNFKDQLPIESKKLVSVNSKSLNKNLNLETVSSTNLSYNSDIGLDQIQSKFFRNKEILSQIEYVQGTWKRNISFDYNSNGNLTRIKSPEGNETRYNYINAPAKNTSAEYQIFNGNMSYSFGGKNLWPQAKSTCIEDICYVQTDFYENPEDLENKKNAFTQIKAFRGDGNALPHEIYTGSFGVLPNQNANTPFVSGKYNWQFVPLDEAHFLVYSTGKDVGWDVAYIFGLNSAKNGFDLKIDLSKPGLGSADPNWDLNNVEIGDRFIVSEYKNKNIDQKLFKICERNESSLQWVEVPNDRIEKIETGTTQFGQEIRNQDNQFALEIDGSGDADFAGSLSVSGNNFVIFHQYQDVSVNYKRDPNGYYHLMNHKVTCNTSNIYSESDKMLAGYTVGDGSVHKIRENNIDMCFMNNLDESTEKANFFGSWYALYETINKNGRERLRIYYNIGDYYKSVAVVENIISNPLYADQKFFMYRGSDGFYSIPFKQNINEVKAISQTIHNDCNSNTENSDMTCRQKLFDQIDDKKSNALFYKASLIPGGYAFQGIADYQLPSFDFSNGGSKNNPLKGKYEIKIFKSKLDWDKGNGNPLVEVQNIQIDGVNIDRSKIRSIDYSPNDGKIHVQYSLFTSGGDQYGWSCLPFNGNVCELRDVGYAWTWEGTDNNPVLSLSSKQMVQYSSYNSSENTLLTYSVNNFQKYQVKTFYTGSDLKVQFALNRGFGYDINPSIVPQVVSEVVQTNPVVEQLGKPVARTAIKYIAEASNETCLNLPKGAVDGYGGVAYTPAGFYPKFRTVAMTQCRNSTGDCWQDGVYANPRSIYSFYLQGLSTDASISDQYVPEPASGGSYLPALQMDGQLVQQVQCGRQNEVRSLQRNFFRFDQESDWPVGLVQSVLDSSLSVSLDKQGQILGRQDSKTLSLDPLTRTPLETHQWNSKFGGRQLSVQKTSLQTKTYGVAEDAFSIRYPAYGEQYLFPKVQAYPNVLEDNLVSKTRSGLTGALVHPLFMPKYTYAWLKNRLFPTDQELQEGVDLSLTGTKDGRWIVTAENTRVNSQRQIEESKSKPVVIGLDEIYQTAIYEGPYHLTSASFSNAPWNSVAFLGAEDGFAENHYLDNQWELANYMQMTSQDAYSGEYSVQVQGQYGPTKNVELAANRVDEGYRVSVWMKSTGRAPCLTAEIRQENGTEHGAYKGVYSTFIPVTGTFKPNTWQRYELRLSPQQMRIGGSFASVKSWLRLWAGYWQSPLSSEKVYVDDFVAYPSAARFTLSAYDFRGRLTSQTNANHEKNTIEYAPDGSVLASRDSKGLIFNQEFSQPARLRP